MPHFLLHVTITEAFYNSYNRDPIEYDRNVKRAVSELFYYYHRPNNLVYDLD